MENVSFQPVSNDVSLTSIDQRPALGFDENDFGVLSDFIEHVRGVIPLLENVKHSIEDSSSRIPKASMQLSKVTEATESATVEILNMVEAVTGQISNSVKDLRGLKQFVSTATQLPGYEEAMQAIASIEKNLSETQDNSMSIAMALQVQDITSQQIAGVSHTIETIRKQLFHALKRFDEPPQAPGPDQTERDASTVDKHFDGDANFTKAPDRQDLADEIIKQWNQSKAV